MEEACNAVLIQATGDVMLVYRDVPQIAESLD